MRIIVNERRIIEVPARLMMILPNRLARVIVYFILLPKILSCMFNIGVRSHATCAAFLNLRPSSSGHKMFINLCSIFEIISELSSFIHIIFTKLLESFYLFIQETDKGEDLGRSNSLKLAELASDTASIFNYFTFEFYDQIFTFLCPHVD